MRVRWIIHRFGSWTNGFVALDWTKMVRLSLIESRLHWIDKRWNLMPFFLLFDYFKCNWSLMGKFFFVELLESFWRKFANIRNIKFWNFGSLDFWKKEKELIKFVINENCNSNNSNSSSTRIRKCNSGCCTLEYIEKMM